METKEKIIAQLGKAVVVLGSLCIVLAVIIVLMLNARYTTDVELAVGGNEGPTPPKPPKIEIPEGHEQGYKLFKTHCASCHTTTEQIITGPGLAGVMTRVPDAGWLRKWVKNADAMKKSGDKYAQEVDNKFKGANMSPFTFLSDEEIESIIGYVEAATK